MVPTYRSHRDAWFLVRARSFTPQPVLFGGCRRGRLRLAGGVCRGAESGCTGRRSRRRFKDQRPARLSRRHEGVSSRSRPTRASSAGARSPASSRTSPCALAESLFELLDGENPTRIEHLWQKLYRSHRDMRGGPFMTHALSAIDMALWDITGKLWGVPVYRLLGGPMRDKIRMLSHAQGHTSPAPAARIPFSGNPQDIEQPGQAWSSRPASGSARTARSCSTPTAPCRRPMLIQFAAAIEPYDVLFIEEPAVPGNIEVFKRLKEQIRIPLATGERDRTIWEHDRRTCRSGCIDILQPDCRPHRRHHPDEEDRHAGRGVLRAARAALHLLASWA